MSSSFQKRPALFKRSGLGSLKFALAFSSLAKQICYLTRGALMPEARGMQILLCASGCCPRSLQLHCDYGFTQWQKPAVSEVVECSCERGLMLCQEILDGVIALPLNICVNYRASSC